jgi:isopentenyldiphosphate isomerase
LTELGLEITHLNPVGNFEYWATDPATGLAEWEVDHVFVGRVDQLPTPQVAEAQETRWFVIGQDDPSILAFPRATPWAQRVLELAHRDLTI